MSDYRQSIKDPSPNSTDIKQPATDRNRGIVITQKQWSMTRVYLAMLRPPWALRASVQSVRLGPITWRLWGKVCPVICLVCRELCLERQQAQLHNPIGGDLGSLHEPLLWQWGYPNSWEMGCFPYGEYVLACVRTILQMEWRSLQFKLNQPHIRRAVD